MRYREGHIDDERMCSRMPYCGTARILFLLRVIGGWILAVGSFIVAIAVTAEFFAIPPDPPGLAGSYAIEIKPAGK